MIYTGSCRYPLIKRYPNIKLLFYVEELIIFILNKNRFLFQVPLTPEELETLDKLIPNIAESSKKKIINIISQVKLKDSHLGQYSTVQQKIKQY